MEDDQWKRSQSSNGFWAQEGGTQPAVAYPDQTAPIVRVPDGGYGAPRNKFSADFGVKPLSVNLWMPSGILDHPISDGVTS
jgi:hypothetical protein